MSIADDTYRPVGDMVVGEQLEYEADDGAKENNCHTFGQIVELGLYQYVNKQDRESYTHTQKRKYTK